MGASRYLSQGSRGFTAGCTVSATKRASGGLPKLRRAPTTSRHCFQEMGLLPGSLPKSHPPTQQRKWSMETSSLHPGSPVKDNPLCQGGCGETRTAPQSWEWKAPPTALLPSPSLSLSPGSQGPSQPRSTYLWGIKAALKPAPVPRSHQKVPESLTRWLREALPASTISES